MHTTALSAQLLLQANSEKLRLEQKQRAARRAADRGDPIKPRWFRANADKRDADDLAYVYNGGYFEARAAGNYEVSCVSLAVRSCRAHAKACQLAQGRLRPVLKSVL